MRALTQPDFHDFDTGRRPAISAVAMTMYDETFTVPVAFAPFTLARIVAEVLSAHGKTQFRTAETEKCASWCRARKWRPTISNPR